MTTPNHRHKPQHDVVLNGAVSTSLPANQPSPSILKRKRSHSATTAAASNMKKVVHFECLSSTSKDDTRHSNEPTTVPILKIRKRTITDGEAKGGKDGSNSKDRRQAKNDMKLPPNKKIKSDSVTKRARTEPSGGACDKRQKHKKAYSEGSVRKKQSREAAQPKASASSSSGVAVTGKTIRTSRKEPGDSIFEVEAIVAHRVVRESCQFEYLLKWKGYPSSGNTWEPISNLNCDKLLEAYLYQAGISIGNPVSLQCVARNRREAARQSSGMTKTEPVVVDSDQEEKLSTQAASLAKEQASVSKSAPCKKSTPSSSSGDDARTVKEKSIKKVASRSRQITTKPSRAAIDNKCTSNNSKEHIPTVGEKIVKFAPESCKGLSRVAIDNRSTSNSSKDFREKPVKVASQSRQITFRAAIDDQSTSNSSKGPIPTVEEKELVELASESGHISTSPSRADNESTSASSKDVTVVREKPFKVASKSRQITLRAAIDNSTSNSNKATVGEKLVELASKRRQITKGLSRAATDNQSSSREAIPTVGKRLTSESGHISTSPSRADNQSTSASSKDVTIVREKPIKVASKSRQITLRAAIDNSTSNSSKATVGENLVDLASKHRQVTKRLSRAATDDQSSSREAIPTVGKRLVELASESHHISTSLSRADSQSTSASSKDVTIVREKPVKVASKNRQITFRAAIDNQTTSNSSKEHIPTVGEKVVELASESRRITKSLSQPSYQNLIEAEVRRKMASNTHGNSPQKADPDVQRTEKAMNKSSPKSHRLNCNSSPRRSLQHSLPTSQLQSLKNFLPKSLQSSPGPPFLNGEKCSRFLAANSAAALPPHKKSPHSWDGSGYTAARVRPFCGKADDASITSLFNKQHEARNDKSPPTVSLLSLFNSPSSSPGASGIKMAVHSPLPLHSALSSRLSLPNFQQQVTGGIPPSPLHSDYSGYCSSLLNTPPSESMMAEDGGKESGVLDSSFVLNLSPSSSDISSASSNIDMAENERLSPECSPVVVLDDDDDDKESSDDGAFTGGPLVRQPLSMSWKNSSKPHLKLATPEDPIINGRNGFPDKAIVSPQSSPASKYGFIYSKRRIFSPLAQSPRKIPNGVNQQRGSSKDQSRKSKISRRMHRHTLAASESQLLAQVFKGNGKIFTKDRLNVRRHTVNGLSNSERMVLIDLTQEDSESDSEVWSQSRLRKRCRSVSPPALRRVNSTHQQQDHHHHPAAAAAAAEATVSTVRESPPGESCASAKVVQPSPTSSDLLSARCRVFHSRKFDELLAYRNELNNWQFELNRQRANKEAIIFVENRVDMAPVPCNFQYITSNIYGPGVPNPLFDGSLCGCQCYVLGKKCGPKAQHCCPNMAGAQFCYTITGKVKVEPGTPIYECNSKCSCPMDCSNRVIQLGRKIPLTIFRTANHTGWGVKAVEPIKKGSFITEYVGEVITTEAAESRGEKYDLEGMTYLFDLDFDDENTAFTIDSAYVGNISHFFNHACDPNLVVYSVWIDTLDKRLPRIAFFSLRNISAGEELMFDYQMNHSLLSSATHSPSKSGGQFLCLCGSEKCHGYLY